MYRLDGTTYCFRFAFPMLFTLTSNNGEEMDCDALYRYLAFAPRIVAII